jgi:MFS family permease
MGSGVFMPMSLLYFIAVTPLTLVQVGLAVSLGSAAALPAGLLIGGAVDKWGARSVLLAGNALQALGFVAYLWTQSLIAVTVWTVVIAVGRSAFWGSYGAIVAAISSPGERERWFGFLGALRNVGFAVGGLASGVAITLDSRAVFAWVVVVNAASYAVAFALLWGVPDSRGAPDDALPGTWREVIVDSAYRWLVVTQLGHSLAIMVLNFA